MKVIIVLTFGLAIAGFAIAQEQSKQAKIERILALTKADTVVDQIFNQVKSMAASQMPPGATEEQKAKAQEMQGKIMDIVKARMGWEKMRPLYVKLYDETYSEAEIDGILGFYQSPAGRAMMEKMPVLLAKSMTMVQSQMADIMPEIQRVIKETVQSGK